MSITDALAAALGDARVISLTGSGGKTSTLKALAEAFVSRGERVLMTTTTKLASPDKFCYGERYSVEAYNHLHKLPSDVGSVLWAVPDSLRGKLVAPPLEDLRAAARSSLFDRILIEADGAAGRPLKLHELRDPVIIPETEAVIAVAGLSSLSMSVKEAVFSRIGSEALIAEGLLPLSGEDVKVGFDTLRKLLKSREGILKGACGQNRKTVVFFNQADTVSGEIPADWEVPKGVKVFVGSVCDER